MKAFSISADNDITVHASRKAARETGDGVFSADVAIKGVRLSLGAERRAAPQKPWFPTTSPFGNH
jgi:hypothetical protein